MRLLCRKGLINDMADLDILKLLLVFASGLAAGFVNILAGGGSFLTLAALEMLGLPTAMANGTNRVAIAVESASAMAGFRSKGFRHWREALALAAPTLAGSLLGAYLVIDLPAQTFQRVLGVAMLGMLGSMLVEPRSWLRPRGAVLAGRRRWLTYAALFGVGVYGGAIQAGVGFMLIAALVLGAGLDLVRTAAYKAVIVGVFTLAALAVFVAGGQVNWLVGGVLALGNGLGGWIASRMAVERGERFVRVAMMVVLAILALRYLGLLPWL
ncbi:MAG: sulfite exporter TauE/SafE family protein [Anaerolineae bacterium]